MSRFPQTLMLSTLHAALYLQAALKSFVEVPPNIHMLIGQARSRATAVNSGY